ncbi:MAG: multidrug transporter ATP-binding protein [Bacilli bacterium]|nr:multidrug transporter ATP-binding protein [Bacilli bacterium]
MSTSAVVVDNLSKRFGDFQAVDAVSFRVEPGECFGLLGPNGAGKSTTIKMMTTLLRHDSGSVHIGSYDLRQQPNRIRERIGYVPQAISVDGALTGYENLLIMAKLFGLSKQERLERISSVLATLELEDAANRPAQTYSGGMVRRLEIGQAILHRPDVLFLDEPTVGLDPMARKSVWTHIANLRHEFGMSIIMTTHYMEEADSMCSTIAIMSKGKIAAMGNFAQLREQTGNPTASMDDIFTHFAGFFDHTQQGGMRDVARSRRTASRLG